MPAYKADNGTWYMQFYYEQDGKRKHKVKRGFESQREALVWEDEFLASVSDCMTMKFSDFVKRYEEDVKPRVKYNTWRTKQHMIDNKIMPFFKDMRMCDITPKDVLRWQNTIIGGYDDEENEWSQTYLRTINSQLSALFNHAVRFYGLQSSPVKKTKPMGDKKGPEMKFWTKEQYPRFSDAIMAKEDAYLAFEILYWCGLRVGELLALTPSDIDARKKVLSVSKSYQRIERQDYITDPKTPKSKRVIVIPSFLAEEIDDYLGNHPDIGRKDRLSPRSKGWLRGAMRTGCKQCGLEPIRIHDLRHSHVSLLIDMGFTALAIADRMGHESVDITFRYAHLFPNLQTQMANDLDAARGF